MEKGIRDMKIDAHIIAWNEEKILPFTLDHYSSFCEAIYVWDNMSDDSSDEIYKRYPKVKVIKWDSGNEINELNYVSIKSNCYKQLSRDKDWVIVCDCDEFLYHPNIIDKLKEYKANGVTVPKISGHDMVSESFPEYDGIPLPGKVTVGSEYYEPMSKNIIFDPSINIQYGIGGHSITGDGIVYSDNVEFKLLHYKFLGKDYVRKIYESRAARLSKFNKDRKFGEHYYNVPFQYMDTLLKNNYKVI
jgi:hypothetical protein